MIYFTLVEARLGFFGGDRTGPDSASDHSSVEIEIVGFLMGGVLKHGPEMSELTLFKTQNKNCMQSILVTDKS